MLQAELTWAERAARWERMWSHSREAPSPPPARCQASCAVSSATPMASQHSRSCSHCTLSPTRSWCRAKVQINEALVTI
ncbi:hypothetical protein E2C01_023665 [Portunus trituberculatus]|uniref:Uncharacterized protein n=1 Tax=Portunus trituberculatus TaxID=210409 RepID=A0A5B7E8U2_PORTR|nr:hypothetical protein [Portunus trituberculatus]